MRQLKTFEGVVEDAVATMSDRQLMATQEIGLFYKRQGITWMANKTDIPLLPIVQRVIRKRIKKGD